MTALRVRGIAAAVLVTVTVTGAATVAGCAGEAEDERPTRRPRPGGVYTADQLEQALLSRIAGYQPAGAPESGEYGSLQAVRNFGRLQRAVKVDQPGCAMATRAFASMDEVRHAPAAVATFAKNFNTTATETLMAISSELADQQVRLRVPAGCRTFRARVGDRRSTHRIIEATRGRIGQRSRTVGVATATGAVRVKTWFVVLRSHGYLATITVNGPAATRAEAERLARQAYAEAERILP